MPTTPTRGKRICRSRGAVVRATLHRAVALVGGATLGTYLVVRTLEFPSTLVVEAPRTLLLLWMAWAFFRGADDRGEHLLIARDGMLYRRSARAVDRRQPVTAVDPARAELRTTLHGWMPIPGLSSDPAKRAEELAWIDGAFAPRARVVPDALLELPSLDAVREELGLGVGRAGPFRGREASVSRERASSLLDDRGASGAELVAAALVLAEAGDPVDRARIAAVADDCHTPAMRTLLVDVAARSPAAAAAYDRLRGAPTALQEVFSSVLLAGVVATVLARAAATAFGAPLDWSLIAGALAATGLGWAVRKGPLRSFRERLAWVRHRSMAWHAGSFFAGLLGLRLAPAGVVPHALAPLLLYLAWWLPAFVPRLAPLRLASNARVEDVGAFATKTGTTGVRIDVDVPASTGDAPTAEGVVVDDAVEGAAKVEAER